MGIFGSSCCSSSDISVPPAGSCTCTLASRPSAHAHAHLPFFRWVDGFLLAYLRNSCISVAQFRRTGAATRVAKGSTRYHVLIHSSHLFEAHRLAEVFLLAM